MLIWVFKVKQRLVDTVVFSLFKKYLALLVVCTHGCPWSFLIGLLWMGIEKSCNENHSSLTAPHNWAPCELDMVPRGSGLLWAHPWGLGPLFVFTQAWPHFQVVTWEGQWREGGVKEMMRGKRRRGGLGWVFVFTAKGQRSYNQKCPFIGYIIKPQGAHQCSQSGVWLC